MEDNKTRTRYQDNGCSFVVEVQPSYQNEGSEASKGSTDDVDQQALVHREEIAEDRTSGTFRYDSNKGERGGERMDSSFSHRKRRNRFRKHEAVREHEHRIVAVGSLHL